jgi:hypothetical protein
MKDITYRMKIREGVEANLSLIVKQVMELVDKAQPEKRGMKTAQLDNFLGVTREMDSVAVVQNWVRYQIGREQGAWHQKKFGDTVLNHIAGWEPTASDIAAEAYGVQQPDKPTPAQVETAWIELIRQYAGQLRRYFTYANFQEEERKKAQHAQQGKKTGGKGR